MFCNPWADRSVNFHGESAFYYFEEKNMRRILLVSLLFIATCVAADVTGNWSGEGQADGETHPLYFVLKEDGKTLSGSGGPSASQQRPIQNGKVEGGKISFDLALPNVSLHFELAPGEGGLQGTVHVVTDEEDQSGIVSLKRAA
jgi:hypothetical protein